MLAAAMAQLPVAAARTPALRASTPRSPAGSMSSPASAPWYAGALPGAGWRRPVPFSSGVPQRLLRREHQPHLGARAEATGTPGSQPPAEQAQGQSKALLGSVGLFFLWVALAVYAFLMAPNQTPLRDQYFLEKLVGLGADDGVPINAIFTQLFFIMGVWPLIYTALLIPSGKSANGVPAWPFVALSYGVGECPAGTVGAGLHIANAVRSACTPMSMRATHFLCSGLASCCRRLRPASLHGALAAAQPAPTGACRQGGPGGRGQPDAEGHGDPCACHPGTGGQHRLHLPGGHRGARRLD